MSKLKVKLTSLDGVDEAVKAFYLQKGDEFILQVDGIQEHPETAALKTALDREKNTRKSIEEKYTALNERLGGLPEDFNLTEYNKLKDGQAGNVDQKLNDQRERLTKEKETEVGNVTKDRDKYKSIAEKQASDAVLSDAIAEAGIAKPFIQAIRAMFKEKIKISYENDEAIVTIDNMPVAQAVKAFAESDDGKHYVQAKGNGGGGSDGNGNERTNTEGNPWAKGKENFTEQMNLERTNPTLATKYKKEAGVK